MKQLILIVLIGALTVILFDTLASFVSRSFQIRYELFSIVSFLIYSCIGFFSGRHNSLTSSALAAGVVGLADSTLGWYISWIVGPGRIEGEMNSATISIMVVFVMVTASILGLLGGLMSRWVIL